MMNSRVFRCEKNPIPLQNRGNRQVFMNQCNVLLAALQEVFANNSDSERAKGQQAYMKSTMPYWGITLPEIRKISNRIFKNYVPKNNDEYRDTVIFLFKNAKRREEWYAGMHYAKKFKLFIIPENIDLYLEIIRLTQWWDIVDDCAVHLVGASLKQSGNLEKYLKTWIVDDNKWVRRTALLTQLKYKEQTDADLLAQLILMVVDQKEFFIRKAIGWALRDYSYTDPEWIKLFIKKHADKLSGLSVREGLKAIKRLQARK